MQPTILVSSIGSDFCVLSSLSHNTTCFFFFQAEDGIRDLIVTGVQTCALPIFDGDVTRSGVRDHVAGAADPAGGAAVPDGDQQVGAVQGGRPLTLPLAATGVLRSEERRVGKECRSRWSPYH